MTRFQQRNSSCDRRKRIFFVVSGADYWFSLVNYQQQKALTTVYLCAITTIDLSVLKAPVWNNSHFSYSFYFLHLITLLFWGFFYALNSSFPQ
jgi:hypothetical protein